MAAYDPNNSLTNPYGASSGGPGSVTKISDGNYVDPSGQYWSGTWENPTRIPAPSNPAPPVVDQGPTNNIPAPSYPAPPVSNSNPFPMQQYKMSASQQSGMSAPANANDPNLQSYISYWASQNGGSNPSVRNDPGYWAQAIQRTHGSGPVDWNYWYSRFNTPEGAPEGAGGGGGAPTNYSWDQALSQVNQAAGRQLSPAEINQLLSKYGGTAGSSVSAQGLAPVLAGLRSSGMSGNGGTQFGDPAYNQLSQMAQQRIGNLNSPVSFPWLNDYMSQLAGTEGAARYRALNFAQDLQSRIGQLQQALLTDANVANQTALARNNLLGQRDTALASARERLSARGFDPTTSGLSEGSNRAINEQFSNQDANIQAQLQRSMIATDEQRRNQATQLQGLATQALQGGDTSALQYASSLSDLENQMFNMNENRQREALTTAGIPVDLTNNGFTNANNAANGGGDPMSSIMQILQAGNQQQSLMQGNSNSTWQALAFMLQQALGR